MSGIYTVGVRLVAYNEAHGALAAVASQMLNLHHLVNNTNLALGRFRMALGGMAAAFAGDHIVRSMAKIVDHGGELLKIQNQMRAGGWNATDTEHATDKAFKLSAQYRTISTAQILEMQKEMAPVLGDRHHAYEIAEVMTKMQVSMQGVLGTEKAASFNKQIRDAVRAGELSGNALQPERFEKYLETMTRALNAFGGTVTPSDFFMATKYGRAASLNWSDRFTGEVLPTIMQELGSNSSGTAFMTMYSAIIGGRMRQKSIDKWDELGLIDRTKLDPNNLTAEGRIKSISPQAFVGSRMMMTDPDKWISEVVLPAMIKKGVLSPAGLEAIKAGNIKEGAGEEARKQITEYVALLFGDRTAAGMADILALQLRKLDRDAKLVREADKDGSRFMTDDYNMSKTAVSTQWEQLSQVLAGPMMKEATDALNALAKGISGFREELRTMPAVTTAAVKGIMAFGAALVLLGTGLLISAVGGWPIVIGSLIVGLLTAAFAYVTRNMSWEKIGTLLSTISKGIVTTMVGIATDIGKALANAIMSIPGMVMGAISGMASAIGKAISGAISGLFGFGGGKGGGGGEMPSMDGSGAVIPQRNVVPPSGGRANGVQNINLNVDGRRMAQVTVNHIVGSSQHTTGGAGFDSVSASTPVDFHA
jgi:hypothetical protein